MNDQAATALVTIGSIDSSTIFVRLPAALADLESAAVSEDELKHVLQAAVSTAPPDSRWHVVIDGPALVGVIELQGNVFQGKRLERPTDEERTAVVKAVTRELVHLGYDVNPDSKPAISGEDHAKYYEDFIRRATS